MIPEWVPLLSEAPILVVVVMATTAPWVGAVLSGKLLTKGQSDARIADLVSSQDRERKLLEAQLKNERDEKTLAFKAVDVQRDRADRLAAQLGESALEYGQVATHLLHSLPRVGDNGPRAIGDGGER